jgi:hypothetical protein
MVEYNRFNVLIERDRIEEVWSCCVLIAVFWIESERSVERLNRLTKRLMEDTTAIVAVDATRTFAESVEKTAFRENKEIVDKVETNPTVGKWNVEKAVFKRRVENDESEATPLVKTSVEIPFVESVSRFNVGPISRLVTVKLPVVERVENVNEDIVKKLVDNEDAFRSWLANRMDTTDETGKVEKFNRWRVKVSVTREEIVPRVVVRFTVEIVEINVGRTTVKKRVDRVEKNPTFVENRLIVTVEKNALDVVKKIDDSCVVENVLELMPRNVKFRTSVRVALTSVTEAMPTKRVWADNEEIDPTNAFRRTVDKIFVEKEEIEKVDVINRSVDNSETTVLAALRRYTVRSGILPTRVARRRVERVEIDPTNDERVKEDNVEKVPSRIIKSTIVLAVLICLAVTRRSVWREEITLVYAKDVTVERVET